MKNIDLDSEIKGLRVPERSQEFWDAFPDRVLEELRAAPANRPAREPSMPRVAWGFGIALACIVLGFSFGQSGAPKRLYYAVVKHERALSESVRQFPGHVCALMQDEHGMWVVMEDQQ
jgi:hypothetical protein